MKKFLKNVARVLSDIGVFVVGTAVLMLSGVFFGIYFVAMCALIPVVAIYYAVRDGESLTDMFLEQVENLFEAIKKSISKL